MDIVHYKSTSIHSDYLVLHSRFHFAGVTLIALTSRTLSERHVLEIDGGQAVLWHEGKWPNKSLGSYESKTGSILTAGTWTRILLRFRL